MSFWPNKGEADPRPPLGCAVPPLAPVPPANPAVPPNAPGALRRHPPPPATAPPVRGIDLRDTQCDRDGACGAGAGRGRDCR